MISGDLMYDPDQLTITCISTGGPATTVTWTRDSTTVITEGTQTVLNDPQTARYTHTLTVTTGGVYTCTVANDKPASASASFTVTVTGMINTNSFGVFLSVQDSTRPANSHIANPHIEKNLAF